jgi:hypothetical protein
VSEAFRKLVDDGYHGVTAVDRQRAARAEVILHVDHEKQVVGPDLHGPPVANALFRLNRKAASIPAPISGN